MSTNNRHPAARLPVDAPSSLEAGILADLHILETVLCGCRDPERQVALRRAIGRLRAKLGAPTAGPIVPPIPLHVAMSSPKGETIR